MSGLSIFLMLIASALLLAAARLAVVLLRLQRERSGLVALLDPPRPELLLETARQLHESASAAEKCDRAEQRLGQMVLSSPIPVLLVNDVRKIIALSASAEEELDQPRIRRGLLETLGSHELDDAVRQALESLKPAQPTVRLYAKGRRPFVAHIFPYRNGRRHESLVFLQNATATVEFGELRSQFAATVSHELRTPLAGIRALVESLRDPDIGAEDASRFLERLDHETSRLGQLIDDILFLSSLESGGAEIQGVSDLRSVIEKVMEKLEPQTRRFGVRLEIGIPAGLQIPLPERMASTVMGNLMENAVKYSGRGSRVRISAQREATTARVTVSDDGIGIDPEHLPHIFERFYRVDKSRSRHLGGTGLGLSIVKHVVESAGGEVAADSREGFGTAITFRLPLPAA